MRSDQTSWSTPPSGPVRLKEDSVHVWRCRFDEAVRDEHKLIDMLSSDERARAARFRTESSRRQFVLSRGVLRDVLRRYTGSRAHELHFAYTAFGKPCLSGLEFNLTHSNNICLIAVSSRRRVGVDIEYAASVIDHDAVARESFSSEEFANFTAVDSELRTQTFFEIWTRKEAHLKAIGEGLFADLHKTAPDASLWTIRTFSPDEDYIAAAALEARHFEIEAFDWRMSGEF
jgi:4'-phosphopantetheinyl transferase